MANGKRATQQSTIEALLGGWKPAIIRSRTLAKVHHPIGTSGVVFGYAAYLISRGFFDPARTSWRSAPWWCSSGRCAVRRGCCPGGFSWNGHFLGAVGGVVAAWVLARPRESAPASL
jgi:membrane associated rhomboid family serine protease